MKLTAISGACFAVLVFLVGCSEVKAPAGGGFEPAHRGVLTVATDFLPQPGFWEGKDGLAGGFEAGLAKEFAEQFELDEVTVIERSFEQLIAGDLGGADLAMAQITLTSEREEVLDFSEPYLSANPGVLVAEGFEVKDVMEARDLTWAVQKGTTLEEALDKRIVPAANVSHLLTQPAVVKAVKRGKVDAALLDLPVALAYARDDDELSVAAQIATDEALAVALPEGSANREAVSTAIRAMINDGTLAGLAEEWLGAGLRGDAFTVEEVRLLRTK